MKKSILEDLYYGNIHPDEDYTPCTDEYRQIIAAHLEKTGTFQKRLADIDPELQRTYVHLTDDLTRMLPMEMCTIYIDGFRRGARMMLEILTGESSAVDLCEK